MDGSHKGKSSSYQVLGGHKHYDIGGIKVLVSYVISKGHVIKDSGDFIGRSPSG